MNALLKWKVALYLTAIFAAGSAAGWMVGIKTTKEKMLTPPRTEEIASHVRHDVHQELNLSPDQSAKVDAIIEQSSKEMKSLFDVHLQRVRLVVSNRNARIAAILTPEQKGQFDELEKRRHEAGPPRHRRGWRPPPKPAKSDTKTNCGPTP